MVRGGQLAFAVAAGYVLGRRRRMRWALALGTAAAVGRATAGGRGLPGRGALPGASPGLSRLLEAGRPLMSAGAAATRTAVGGRIDGAADRLQQTAERLRSVGRPDTGDAAREHEDSAEERLDDRYDEEPYDDEAEYDDGDDTGYDDRDGGDEDDVDDDRDDSARSRAVRRADADRPPVRRRGR
jgi:hypothetical protein